MDFSLLDTLFSPAAAAPAPQPQPADQAPGDDLALRAEIARRLRESFERGVNGGNQDQPASQPGGWQTSVQNAPALPKPTPAPIVPQNSTSAFTGAAVPSGASVTMGKLQDASAQPQEAAQPQRQVPAPSVAPQSSPAVQQSSQAVQRQAEIPPLLGELSPGETLSALFGGMGGKGLSAVQRERAIQTQTYQALVKSGMSPELAQVATLNASNPAVASLVSQSLSPNTEWHGDKLYVTKGPNRGQVVIDATADAMKRQTSDFKLPSGDVVTGTFEPTIQGHVAPDGTIMSGPLIGQNIHTLGQQQQGQQGRQPASATSGQPLVTPQPQQLGTGGSAPQPLGPTGSSSPYAIPAPPPGANAKAFREEMSKKTSDEMANDREKSIGAVEFLQQSEAARQAINDHGNVIGPYAKPDQHVTSGGGWGSDLVNALATLPSIAVQEGRKINQGLPNWLVGQGNTPDRNTIGEDNAARKDLDQKFTRLAQAGLKATYGSRVTNVDVGQQAQTVPQLTDTDAKNSLDKLNEVEKTSWRNLDRGINSGLVDAATIDPDILARGVANGQLHLPPALAEAVRNYAASKGAR